MACKRSPVRFWSAPLTCCSRGDVPTLRYAPAPVAGGLDERSDPEPLGGDPDGDAVQAEQRVSVAFYREVADSPWHVAEVPRERADVGEGGGGGADRGLFHTQTRALELLDREVDVEVVVRGRFESQELVELACSRTGLLGDEHAPVTQRSADLDCDEGFVTIDNQVERRLAQGEATVSLAGRLIR